MRVTIRDVAQRAGVSKATVSYVLNGHGTMMRIPEETKQRVLAVVNEMGYHPNALARSLAQKRTHTVAVVLQFPRVFSGWSGFTNEMMRGATDAAIRLGYDLLLHTRQLEPEDEPAMEADALLAAEVATLTDGRVDGALLLRDVEDRLAGALREQRFPAVLMFTRSEQPDLWFVDCDNILGGMLATEHLISLGHRRIVHLSGSPRSGAARDRLAGFRKALQNAGIPERPEWIVESTYPGADFTPATTLFDAPAAERPTAIFAWSDDVAIRIMGVLRQKGLHAPEDVAIVGFDSSPMCDHTDPPLTSVRQPIYDMAVQAFTLLTERIAEHTVAQTQVLVPPELVVRRSCGARRTSQH
ncbi:MAG TPA: LacI family DNA-binding transcriptional regulator [Chthonomonadaceae bacterium]|nr:LacI family DNA-binding transcriptional regulator [Chthonomonadaceae bacterium]